MNDFMLDAGVLNDEQYEYFTWCSTPQEVIEALDKVRHKLNKI